MSFLSAFRFLKGLRRQSAGTLPYAQRKIPEAGLTVHLFSPQREPVSTLVVVPGLHPQGIHDPRYRVLVERCVDAGFQVVAPDILDFRNFQIQERTFESIAALIQALPRYVSARSLTNLGALGISYGAGPAFFAAAKHRIQFVVSIGGYSHLRRAIEFSLTGKHEGSPPRIPQPWGRIIFTLNNLQQLVPPSDRELLRRILLLHLNSADVQAAEAAAQLSAEWKIFLREVLEGLSEDRWDRFREILTQHDELFLQLSPECILPRLHRELRIYLLHGRDDDLIPYEETEELLSVLRRQNHPHVRSLITAALTHVDVRSAGDLFGFLELLYWTRGVLRETVCN